MRRTEGTERTARKDHYPTEQNLDVIMKGRYVSLALLFISALISGRASAKTCQEMGGGFQPSYFRCPGEKIHVTGYASGIVCCVRENRPDMRREDTKSCASMHGQCQSLWLDPCYSGRLYFKTKDCVGRVCCVP